MHEPLEHFTIKDAAQACACMLLMSTSLDLDECRLILKVAFRYAENPDVRDFFQLIWNELSQLEFELDAAEEVL